METLDVLKGTRELLSDPARWTQDAHARNAQGGIVLPTSLDARSWCLIGATIRTSGDEGKGALPRALAECVPPPYRVGRNACVADFNDASTTAHADVLRALDCAIARASS